MNVRDERNRVDQERVAVGLRARRELGSDIARGPAAVVDHHRLPQALGERRRDEPRDHVDAAAGRKGHDQPHRPRRPGFALRRGESRGRDRRSQERGDQDDFLHDASSLERLPGGHADRLAISSTTPSRITAVDSHSNPVTTSPASHTPSKSAMTGLTKV